MDTGENYRQFNLLFPLSFIGQAVHPVGGDRVKGGEIVILARYEFYFTREHENLVLDPSNNKSIFVIFRAINKISKYSFLMYLKITIYFFDNHHL